MFAEQSSAILPDDAPLFLHGMNQLSSATAFIRIIITTSFIPLNSLMVATHQQTTRHHDTQNTFTFFSAVISHNTSATRRHCACIGFFRMASTQSNKPHLHLHPHTLHASMRRAPHARTIHPSYNAPYISAY